MNLADKLANSLATVNGAPAIPNCSYCHTQLTAEEFAALMETGDLSDIMCDKCDKCANSTEVVDPIQAEIAALKAENARLSGAKTAQPETPKPNPPNDLAAQLAATLAQNKALQDAKAAKLARKAAAIPSKPNPHAGTYPTTATAQDKVLLDALVALRPKTMDPKYTVPGVFGAMLYSYLHEALRVKYPPTKGTPKDGKPTWNWELADAKLRPAVNSAIERGIITRIFGSSSVMYFDAREVKGRDFDSARKPAADVVSAISAAF